MSNKLFVVTQMFVVTQTIPQNILILLSFINQIIIPTAIPLIRLTIYCYKKKDFGFQRLSPHMTRIENVVQNAITNDTTYN